jgi:hypothetical protein
MVSPGFLLGTDRKIANQGPDSGEAPLNQNSYPTYLQQIQTISTNPAHPNVLLIAHSPATIIYKWHGIQLC